MSDKKTVVIALGFFDSVHKGHRAVIGTAGRLASGLGAETAIFSFSENLKKALGKEEKIVYTSSERRKILTDMGVKEIYFAPASKEFLSMDKEEFLDFLSGLYDVKGYVCGKDYTFGRFGEGDADYLINYAREHGRLAVICDDVEEYGKKISTTEIKKLLAEGKLREANELLGERYSITGTVFEDRKIGHKLGFPTVNIKIDPDKARLKDGVYAGRVKIDDKNYRAIINYGARPTFGLDGKLVEAHIVEFDGMLYGNELTISFDDFMRSIVKFENADELKDRLEQDLREIRSGKYD